MLTQEIKNQLNTILIDYLTPGNHIEPGYDLESYYIDSYGDSCYNQCEFECACVQKLISDIEKNGICEYVDGIEDYENDIYPSEEEILKIQNEAIEYINCLDLAELDY